MTGGEFVGVGIGFVLYQLGRAGLGLLTRRRRARRTATPAPNRGHVRRLP